MTAPTRGRLAAVALVPLFALLVACGGSSEGDEDADAEGGTGSCPATISETAETQPPDDVPTPEGADTAYQYGATGETKAWFFAIDGGPEDLVTLRDGYNEDLEDAGYEIEGSDNEENAEAESEFAGPHEGTAVFNNLCEGKVGLRLKLTT